jgi:hypothetical protein
MDLPLPLEQLRFNVVLWILITAYGISGIWNFFAFIPGMSKEDAEILWCNWNSNYSFRLISSIIFFLFWISLFRYPMLIYISIIETYLVIIIYLLLMIKKWRFFKKNKTKSKKIKKGNFDDDFM